MSQYDVVLFGATSFVGQIMSHYMLAQYPPSSGVTWAMAGRSQSKLDALKSSLGEAGKDIDVLLADASDEESLKALCDKAAVVVSTVGPYALYGEPLIKACVSSGTDYCDLTGEPQWIAKMLERYEAIAKATGARIVHCCGFDSIPSDLGLYYLQQHALEKFGSTCDDVKMRVKAMKGAASGGTVASMVNLIKDVTKDPKLRKVIANPYALCPPEHGFKARQFNQKSARFDNERETWTAPFVMAAINTRVVHRSNALLNNLYGDNFLYEEAMMTGKTAKGGMGANAMSIGLGGFMFAAAIPPTRWLLESFVLPKPGEGPSPEAQERGFYDIRFYGTTRDGQKLAAKVTGDRDPGYGSTAKMLGEAAVCLAKDINKDEKGGGFWTPASVFGETLIGRLEQKAGLTFSLQD